MGVVRNYFTKEPIAGMNVVISEHLGNGIFAYRFSATTNDSGRYEINYELFGNTSTRLKAGFTDLDYQQYISEITNSMVIDKNTPRLVQFDINPYPYNFARIRILNKNKLVGRDSVMVKVGGACYTRRDRIGFTPWPIEPFVLKGKNAEDTKLYKIAPFGPNKVYLNEKLADGSNPEISITDIPFSATDTPYLEVFY